MPTNTKNKAEVKKTYQLQPAIKDKFRPAEAKAMIEAEIEKRLKANPVQNPNDYQVLVRDLADKCKQALRGGMEKDKRYKYMV